MNISEQKLNEILAGIINNYGKKGSISTNALCDIMEKYDTNANQIDYVYKSLGEAGIQIVDEDQRDKELFELYGDGFLKTGAISQLLGLDPHACSMSKGRLIERCRDIMKEIIFY